jgi:hypothetical protein
MKVPVGHIESWSGHIENIPKGWALCDGTNGTLNLRGKPKLLPIPGDDLPAWVFYEDGSPAMLPIQKIKELEE